MDGLGATRAIRQAEAEGSRHGRQRIVGLSGNARNAQRENALEAGMDAFVTKPYKSVSFLFLPFQQCSPGSVDRLHDLVEKLTAGLEPPSPSSAPPPCDFTGIRDPTAVDALSSLARLSIESESSTDDVVETRNEATVVQITSEAGTPRAASRSRDGNGEGVRTFSDNVRRHGAGTKLPVLRDVEAEENELQRKEDDKTADERAKDRGEIDEASESLERSRRATVEEREVRKGEK